MSTGQCGHGARQTWDTIWALPLTTWVEPLALSLSSLLYKMRGTMTSTVVILQGSENKLGDMVTGSREYLVKGSYVHWKFQLVARSRLGR